MSVEPTVASFAPGVAPRAVARLRLRDRIALLYAGLMLFNLTVWGLALTAFHGYPVLLGSAMLAYTFGLRHAADADHIAAIDNVTRKLMQGRRNPMSVGLFFSLGHSTVVVVAFAVLVFATSALDHRIQGFKALGSLIGTAVSAGFLFAIAFANIVILAGAYRSFRRVRNGGRILETDLDMLLGSRGLLGRLFRPVFALIRESWHMYPLGVLFALGFDTATEIGVLGLSASGVAHGLSPWALLLLPALFTAGMTLADTTDSVLMQRAYDWAFIKPIRKLYYNMTMTLLSVIVALAIGGVETLGIIGRQFGLDRGLWGVIATLNGDFGRLGYLILGIFAFTWIVSLAVYRLKGYDRIEIASV